MPAQFQVKNIADTNVDDSEETLIPLLELTLVEDLHSNDRRFLDGAAHTISTWHHNERRIPHMSKLSFQYGFKVFLITLVVWVCSASTVMTAKGSGRRKTSRFDSPSAATTARKSGYEGRDEPSQEGEPVILIFLLPQQ